MAKLRVCSLFSGIGGFEAALPARAFETVLMCESDSAAQAVLRARFPEVPIHNDIRSLRHLPDCDMVVGGWPCQDLSQAGRVAGIGGDRSGLVNEVFRLLASAPRKPQFVLLENVAFALHLQKGRAVEHVVQQFETLGYSWAYRILDTQEFGLPQRRRRLFVLATRDVDPACVLFDGLSEPQEHVEPKQIGFYWTEGNRGIGWSPEAIPPLKGGSGLSIPSPPALWDRTSRAFFCPSLEDAERLQGFSVGWTAQAVDSGLPDRVRWRLVGNAISIPVAKWIGERIIAAQHVGVQQANLPIARTHQSHNFAWGKPGQAKHTSKLESEGPAQPIITPISTFELRDLRPLSKRAASGFLTRLLKSSLSPDPDFVTDLASYCDMSIRPSKAA